MKAFAPFRLDTDNQCLWRRRDKGEDERILLTPKAFAVLRYLVEHAGRLVTHDELLDAVWPSTHVQPQAIKKLILEIRSLLEDPAKKPRYIETLHRRGYRFVAAVSAGTQPAVSAPAVRGKLVGREGPLSELSDCLAKALSGERQILFITGEPGIGKTALVDEFHRRALAKIPGLRIARGQCVEGYGGKEAYYPMLEALGQLCRGAGGDSIVQTVAAQAPTWLVQFPALVKHEQREMLQRELLGATRERMLREIGDALETITSASPLLLVFEDLQWVDRSTLDLLSTLARRRAPAKLMLVATERPLDMIPDHPLKALKQEMLLHGLCRENILDPLGEAEVAEYLAAESSGATLPHGLAELVYRHSEGNPLIMLATLEHMTERNLISRENGAWELRVPLAEIALATPEKLRPMIEAQADRLSKEQREALDTASVAGAAFSARVCAAAAGVDPEDFEELCEELSRRHHIVRSMGFEHFPNRLVSARYGFVHALYREVLYRRLAPGRAARLHQRIGEQLETIFFERLSEAAPELAQHFEHALDWPRAVKYLRLAAETARSRYATREATALLQHALDLSSKLSEADRGAAEIEILEKLGMIHSSEYDPRAIENYEAVASRAASLGLVDTEARALINLAYPLAWFSSERCLKVLERALLLSQRQSARLARATTRMLSYHYRIWSSGWNARDAELSRGVLNEIREVGDPVTLSFYLAVHGMSQWASSQYRDAYRTISEAVSNLLEISDDYLNLSLIFWVHQLFSSSSLLLLGEWGQALREFNAGIAMLDKNGDEYRAKTLRLYLAWAHLHAMDFEGALKICESSFTHPENSVLGVEPTPSSALPEEARISLIIKGSAQSALRNFEPALEHLLTARNAMDQQMVILDWYWRMQLQSSLVDLWLAKGDLKQARIEAEKFLEVTMATAERTWQALAWEANARIAMGERNFEQAHDSITKALSTMDGFEVPLASWRVHATAADLFRRSRNMDLAEHHHELSRATIVKLADSLAADEPLRKAFLSAPAVHKILAPANRTRPTIPTGPISRSSRA